MTVFFFHFCLSFISVILRVYAALVDLFLLKNLAQLCCTTMPLLSSNFVYKVR